MSNPQSVQASMNPPSFGQYGDWRTGQVYYPEIFIPGQQYAGMQARDYVVNLTDGTAGTEVVKLVQIDVPGTVYAICADAADSLGVTEYANPLSLFKLRIEHNSGDRFTTQSTFASTIAGRTGLPRLVGGRAWMWDRGGTIRVGITPRKANLDIDVTLWVIEFRGVQNFSTR